MKPSDLDITVRESDGKPVQCREGFFWRQGAVTQKLSRNEIREFFRSEGSIRFDLSPCPRFRYPQDFDGGMIADLLHRIEFIEKAGTGIRRMRGEARDQGCPEPVFEVAGFFTTIFRPNPAVRAQAAAQEGREVTAEATAEVTAEVRLLKALDGEMSRQALQAALRLKHDEHFRKAYLQPALDAGLVEMSIPDKPRSSKQRYRLTALGRVALEKTEES